MNIAVINGTNIRGITYHMKEMFLEHFVSGNQITQYYPKDIPPFCEGCKNCFLKGEDTCPHYAKTAPIWASMLSADLIVFAYPVYALRAPASVKSLLDHLCVHWMVHRPDPAIFSKTAVIITNSVGAPNGSAQKDVITSLTWMGVSRIFTCGAGMMGDIFWNKISGKHHKMLADKTKKLAGRVACAKPFSRKSIKVSLLFLICKLMHKGVLKTEDIPSLDNQHYIDNGWISAKK